MALTVRESSFRRTWYTLASRQLTLVCPKKHCFGDRYALADSGRLDTAVDGGVSPLRQGLSTRS